MLGLEIHPPDTFPCFFPSLAAWSVPSWGTHAGMAVSAPGPLNQGGCRAPRFPLLALVFFWCPVQTPSLPSPALFPGYCTPATPARTSAPGRGHAALGPLPKPRMWRARGSRWHCPPHCPINSSPWHFAPPVLGSLSLGRVETSRAPVAFLCTAPASDNGASIFLCSHFQSLRFGAAPPPD